MKTKIISISDLCFNFDFTNITKKLQATEDFENKIITTFKQIVGKSSKEGVQFVVLSGKLFEEDTLLVGEIDELVDFINDCNSVKFIIAPDKVNDDMSWYQVINWPKNVTLLSKSNDFVKFDDQSIVFFRGRLDGSLKSSNSMKVAIADDKGTNEPSDLVIIYGKASHNVVNRNYSSGTFTCQQFSAENKNGYFVFDIIDKRYTANFVENKEYSLKKVEFNVNENMKVDDVVNEINKVVTGEQNTYYQILVTGKLGSEITSDIQYSIKDKLKVSNYSIINQTTKNYNVDKIKQDNSDNIIGLFIDEVRNDSMNESEKDKVIEYGLDYLL
jgi:DNA repair protein SbcD/Mre11